MAELEAALLLSIDQVQAGKGRVTTPEQIIARRGHPEGTVKAAPKVASTSGCLPTYQPHFAPQVRAGKRALMLR
jgi:hypothetical protein